MLFIHIEVVLHGFCRMKCVQQLVHLGGIKACQRYVELATIKFSQQCGQLILVPFTLNFVERNVQRSLLHVVNVDDHTVDLCISKVLHYR